MSSNTFIFDLDGTLIDSSHLMSNAFNYALSIYSMKVSAKDLEVMRSLTSEELFRDRLNEEQSKEALSRLWDYSYKSVPDTLLIEGIKPLLKQIEQKNISMGLWTGRDSGSAQQILKHHGIDHYFKALVGGSEVSKNKPHPEGLFLLAKKLNVSIDSLIHIGDHDHDIIGALEAGTQCILAGWCPTAITIEHAHLANFTFGSVHAFSLWVDAQFRE